MKNAIQSTVYLATLLLSVAVVTAVAQQPAKVTPPPAPAKPPAPAPVRTPAPAPRYQPSPRNNRATFPNNQQIPRTYAPPATSLPANRNGATNPPLNRGYRNRETGNPYNSRRPEGAGVPTRSVPPRSEFRAPNGAVAHFGPDGRVREVRSQGVSIVRGPGDSRRIVTQVNGRTILTNRIGHGYVQRPVIYNGREYYHRTYFVNGHTSVVVYRPYIYRGVAYPVYAPMRFYRPGFYAYAYRPWPAPVAYRWGWSSEPWYTEYGPVFQPYPGYSSPRLWLTDYVIASNLQAAYQEQVDAQPNASLSMAAGPAITPEIKGAIADEVQRQLQQGQQGPPPADANPVATGVSLPIFDNTPHTLVVSTNMNVSSGSDDCSITQGDVLQFDGTGPQGADSNVSVRVVWAQRQDCAAGSVISVPIEQLQEMQNQLRARVEQGLGAMQSNAGQNGMPLIASDLLGSTSTDFASQASSPEPNVADELRVQATQGLNVEQQVAQQASLALPEQQSGPMNTSAPPSANVELGQSPAQVISILGSPLQTANVGSKLIFVYRAVKITFIDGKLVDAQ